jgi:hypothetical protein
VTGSNDTTTSIEGEAAGESADGASATGGGDGANSTGGGGGGGGDDGASSTGGGGGGGGDDGASSTGGGGGGGGGDGASSTGGGGGGGGRSEWIPTGMMRCAKIDADFGGLTDGALDSSGTVDCVSRGRDGSLGVRASSGSGAGRASNASPAAASGELAVCERGRGTGGRPPVGVSVVLNAPASLASASPMARSESLPIKAAVAASRDDIEASW